MRTALMTTLLITGCIDYSLDGEETTPVVDAPVDERAPWLGELEDIPQHGQDTGIEDTGPEPPPDCSVDVDEAFELEVDEDCSGEREAYEPVEDPWNIVVEWQITNISSAPTYGEVINLPMIGNLNDDDGDGLITELDVPDIAAVAFESMENYHRGKLVALDGATGAELFTVDDVNSFGGGGMADIDSDGAIEIVVFDHLMRPMAVDSAGNIIWVVPRMATTVHPQATVADLDGDGRPEVIADDMVIDGATGTLLFTLAVSSVTDFRTPTPGDIDLDGVQEIVLGNRVFDGATGALEWEASLAGTWGHWAALLDADGDPEAEVVMLGGGKMGLYEHDGTVIYEVDPAGSNAGPPCVADFDGDGAVEIAFAATMEFVVVELDGTTVWEQPIGDGSGAAGCAGFDFDADGSYEIVYADETDFYILDGATGDILFQDSDHCSGTIWEYPTIADVDLDGSAEIVRVSNDYYYEGTQGITVYGHADAGWPRGGSTWHVHDFAVTNINPDGSVPAHPDPPWQVYNLYRARPWEDLPAGRDLALQLTDICISSCEQDSPVRVSFQPWNQGGRDVLAVIPWAIYRDDDLTLLASGVVEPILGGEALASVEVELSLSQVQGAGLILTIDDDGQGLETVYECDEDNNSIHYTEVICG